jgi:hypothetical protein
MPTPARRGTRKKPVLNKRAAVAKDDQTAAVAAAQQDPLRYRRIVKKGTSPKKVVTPANTNPILSMLLEERLERHAKKKKEEEEAAYLSWLPDGSKVPRPFRLATRQVALEPLWVIRVAVTKNIKLQQLEDEWGVEGRFLEALRKILHQIFDSSDWVKERINKYVLGIKVMLKTMIRSSMHLSPALLSSFFEEQADELELIRDVVTHLTWDKIRKQCGKSAGAKFLVATRLNTINYPQVLHYAVKLATKTTPEAKAALTDEVTNAADLGEKKNASPTRKRKRVFPGK